MAAGVAAGAGGILLGALDFVWIKYVPHPLGDLGNSSAVWAVAAFTFGLRARTGWALTALGAAVLLVVAVPSYYLAATVIQNDDLTVLWAPSSLLWMTFGILAGAVFGTAGMWARTPGRLQAAGAALPGAVLFAEAALLTRRIGDPDYGTTPLWPAVIDATLGVLVVVLAAHAWRQRATALALAVPLAALGFAALVLAGFA